MPRPQDPRRPYRRLPAEALLKRLLAGHYLLTTRAPRLGRKVAWVTSGFPSEALIALGYHLVYPENHAALCGAQKLGVEGSAVFCVDATRISIDELGRPMPNTPMVGALAAARYVSLSGRVSRSSSRTVPPASAMGGTSRPGITWPACGRPTRNPRIGCGSTWTVGARK